MCGICGFNSPRARPERLMSWMLDALASRGPDEQGSFSSEQMALGCARLCILDIHGSQQPLASRSGTVQLVFNGEIYNHASLRRRLVGLGHRFESRGDGEVLIHAYEQWGDLFIQHINGMFAIALWDESRRKLLLYRDRIGIKPLYYHQSAAGFFFASELNSLRRVPGLVRRIDRQALRNYLMLEYVPAPRSIFAEVRKLAPGCMLRLQDGQLQLNPYWSIPTQTVNRMSPRQAVEHLEAILRRAVWRQQQSDVAVGVLLSGGIDSSLVASLAAQNHAGPLDTFTLGFDEPSYDERDPARLVARTLKARHHVELLSAGRAAALLPEVVRYYGEPLGDASVLPTYLLCQMARRHVKVVLTGDGGDEVFGGYPTYGAHLTGAIAARLLPAKIRAGILRLIDTLPVSKRNFGLDFVLRRFLGGLHRDLLTRHLAWMGSFRPTEVDSLLGEPPGSCQLSEIRQLVGPALYGAAPDQARRVDVLSYLPHDLLYKMDHASMAHGLEARPPLLDHEVVKFAFQLPWRWHMGLGCSKSLLKSVARSHLPHSIVKRKKKGFGIPLTEWLRGQQGSLFLDVLSVDNLLQVGMLQPEPVRRLVHEHTSGALNRRKELWTLIVLQRWALEHLS